MKVKHRIFSNSVAGLIAVWVVIGEPLPASAKEGESPWTVAVSEAHGPQHPASVPVLPGVFVGKQVFYGPLVGRPAEGQGYQPAGGDSFAVHNGMQKYHFILSSGMWWLKVGDRPLFDMQVRTGGGAYAQPSMLPDIGVNGRHRVAVTVGEKTKWLDEFSSVDAVLSPGSASWTCSDEELGVTVVLLTRPLLKPWGFVAEANVTAPAPKVVSLAWHVEKAQHVADRGDFVEFSSAKLARLFMGADVKNSKADKGVLRMQLEVTPDVPQRGRFLCVWGYSDYNKQGVADAYKRLEFCPFDAAWLEDMKPKWFDHWIGGGLEPEKKFLDARERMDVVAKQAEDFWTQQRSRVRIKTPDARFDNVVNHVSAQARVQYEYPGFMHGLGYSKYGKINHGYYGFESAGLHDEVANSLQLIAGTQDVTGRQRYNMTTFAISEWHEDMDFYFMEQCWYHWRWTGDEKYLRAIWPAARRALEHGLVVSDPDGDGLMTGFYEMWNCDASNTGGYSALQTAMGWAALRAGIDVAARLGDSGYAGKHGNGQAYDRVTARRYKALFEQTEKQYLGRLWNKDTGAWSSAEVGGPLRPRPHTMEQNYAIWRGLGTPMQNYTAMRYIRENHHHEMIPGSTFEAVNDWWPIQWSVHWVASGDACASFHSACAAGDNDGHWSTFKTIAESAYTTGPRHYGTPAGTLWQGTGSHSLEIEPLFLAAVLDGLFGLKPWFGENLLVLRPSPLADWNELDLNHVDANYKFRRDAEKISLDVITPVPRKVRAELPVTQGLQAVLLNGTPVKYVVEQAVGAARVVIESPSANEHHFEIRLKGEKPKVEGSLQVVAGGKADFRVRNATVTAVHDLQGVLRETAATDSDGKVVLTCTRQGKSTVFLELQCGEVKWLHPLDLDVREPWTIVERYSPPVNSGAPVLQSPTIDVTQRVMKIELANGAGVELAGRAKVTMAGRALQQEVRIPASGQAVLTVAMGDVWDKLSPGSVPVTIELAGRKETKAAVCWDLGTDGGAVSARMHPLGLRTSYNARMSTLFSPATKWRIDYTGAQHGVDRRHPLPLKDERGWVLMNSIMSLHEFGTLPEHVPAKGYLKLDKPGALPVLRGGVPVSAEPERLLALCSTQPYEQFPSSVKLTLSKPKRVEKLYLLTANLVKSLKCYYPGAELVIRYADGSEQLHQMIPPYTMPSVIGNICPGAHVVPIGRLAGNGNHIFDTQAYQSLTDVVLDPSKPVASIELRCVATETLLGVAGVTLLEAK